MPALPRCLGYALASALAVPSLAAAQAPPQTYSYATYFECDPSREARADALMRQIFFPIFDRQVAAKTLTGWGWLAHNLGGHWRRTGYMVATSRDAVLDGQAAVLKEMRARSKAFAELSSICPRHDDYIWRTLTTSAGSGQPSETRSTARVGTYYECNPARNPRADSLVAQPLGTILNRYVRSDGLNSWAWLAHSVGGKYRRLLILNGTNHKTILAIVDSVLADVARQQPAEGKEFGEICYSHEDYLWDIVASKP
jgi:hypothetical protein